MKHLKITAALLAVALLLGLFPTALAAVGSTDTYCSRSLTGQHDWGDWTTTKQATCTQAGSCTRVCDQCGYTQTESIPKKGHSWGKWQTTKEATCEKHGEQTRKCSVCGRTETRETDRKAHSWGEWTVITEPTDFSMGTRSHVCKVCGKEKTEDFYPDPTYKKGDKGDGVKDLQEKLNTAGYDCGKVDGDFGKKTQAAVKAIEEAHGVEPDGIAWPGVQKWLKDDDYDWEPPQDNETPDGVGGPGDEVSPASGEASELYDITVEVEDTTGLKYTSDPVPVHVTFTNSGTKTVDVWCNGLGGIGETWRPSKIVECDFGQLPEYPFGTKWRARLEPNQSATLAVEVCVSKEDLDKDCIERNLPAGFYPPEASESPAYYPDDWPWKKEGQRRDVSFKIGLGDPVLEQLILGGIPMRVGMKAGINLQDYNMGPCVLYKLEADWYAWDKETEQYVFKETVPIMDTSRYPRAISPTYYYFWGQVAEFEVTKELVAESEDGVLKFGLQSRSWTKDGTPVESEFQTTEFIVYDADVLLEAEDTSAGQFPEDGWVKVKLTATNLGEEFMTYSYSECDSDDFWVSYLDHELQADDLSWLTPGASQDAELRIRVFDEDVQAGEVRRTVYLKFVRLHDEDGKRLPADATKEDAAEEEFYDYAIDTNEVEIVIPLLKAPEAPQVTPPPAPKPLGYCVPALTGLGEGTAEWTLKRCPEHYAVAKAANQLLEEARDDAAKLAAYESAIQLWTDALNAEYDAMLAEADDGEKALIEAEKAAFEAQLTAHRAALTPERDPVQVAAQIAELLMKKTAEVCYERHTAPKARTDLYAAAAETLPAAGDNWRCETRTDEIGATLHVSEALCAEHRAIEALAAEAKDAEGWRNVKRAWLAALDGWTNARFLAAEGDAKALIAIDRTAFGQWLAIREALLDQFYPDQPAVVQELLAHAIRARVLENCGD